MPNDANFWECKLSDVFHRVKDLGDSIREDDSLMQLLSQFLDAQAEELALRKCVIMHFIAFSNGDIGCHTSLE